MRTNDKANWERRLAGDKGVPTHPDNPDYGFYRVRSRDKQTWHTIAYWYNEDGKLRCRKDGYEVGEKDACQQWPFASANPITHELYAAVLAGAPWPDLNEAVTLSNKAPPDNSLEALQQAIEDLAREAKKMIEAGPAKTQDAADQASDVANRLGKFWTDADTARQTEKAPHLAAERAVDEKWRSALTLAAIYKRLKDVVVTPFLLQKRREQEQAAAEARRIAEEAARAGNAEVAEQAAKQAEAIASERVTAGTRGRSVGLRGKTVVTIEDRNAVLTYFKDRQEITDLLQKMAEKAVGAGITVPGVNVSKDARAA